MSENEKLSVAGFKTVMDKHRVTLRGADIHDMYEALSTLKAALEATEAERKRLLAGYREIASASDLQMRDGDLARDIAARMLSPECERS